MTLCIFSNPHNPTGRLWTETELKQLAEICFENNVVIISDEVHCDLLRKGKVFTPLEKLFPESDHIVTCMAPSKTFNMAGTLFANPKQHLNPKITPAILTIITRKSSVNVEYISLIINELLRSM